MNLDSITIEPRLRGHWEAVDVGFKLAQRWYWPLFLLWAIPLLVIALPATLVLQHGLIWAYLLIWWFKPLYDRAPLFFASRALFGAPPSVLEALKQSRSLFTFDALAALTWRRFSFTRSYDLPITVLEHLKSNTRAHRLKVLHHRGSGVATATSFICVVLESCLALGGLVLIQILLPQQSDVNLLNGIISDSEAMLWLEHTCYLIAIAVIGPFYVCAGFMLYINRRVELEAWDVEIQFRTLAGQLEQKATTTVQPASNSSQDGTPSGSPDNLSGSSSSKSSGSPGNTAMLVMASLLSGFLLSAPQPSLANTGTVEPVTPRIVNTPEQAQQQIQEIFNSETFNQQQTVTRWRFKNQADERDSNWWDRFVEWLEDLFDFNVDQPEFNKDGANIAALVVEILLWCLAIGVVSWVVYRYRKQIQHWLNRRQPTDKKPAAELPTVMFGLDVATDSLPNDVQAEVSEQIEQHNYRAALSLLYRATLTQLMQHKGLKFSNSTTENECVALVKSSQNETTWRYTQQLTLAWQSLAYGHKTPQPDHIAQLNSHYKEVFGP
ncbi:DUF4129 domain-containing protein [Halioxenophilus aromaticivorans]|uniref:DUF4129 domain-containing protein n=1 Tax=Halioxenophilus aromaticivorans TaxID=1306992 RepID=A0AAV3U350_9ALTE